PSTPPLFRSVEGTQPHVAVGDGAVIALEAEGAAGDVVVDPGAARRAGADDVRVDENAVVQHALETRGRRAVAVLVELRGVAEDVEGLPLARRPRGIRARGVPVVVRSRLLDPARVDGPVRA